MNILITGGSGFIGKNLLRDLSKVYNICAPTRLELDLLKSGVVHSYLKKHNFDYVIHTANYDAVNPYLNNNRHFVLRNNLKMFFNLVKNKHLFNNLIYLGSGAEFDTNFNEYEILPQNEYSLSKAVISQYIQDCNTNIIQLRLCGVYGPYEDVRTRFISNACLRSIQKLPIIIYQNRRIQYIHVYDLCLIIKKLIERGLNSLNRVYNIVDKPTTLLDIANIIKKYGNNTSDIVINKEGWAESYVSRQPSQDNIFNHEFVNLEDGIHHLYGWHLRNGSVL